jgi:uncharacterized membrane protein YbhN (UPF0104 family)
MTTRSKQLAKLIIRILIATGLLVWVFSQIDLGQFRQAVKTARWQFLIAVWVLTVAIFWINSIKIQLILKKQGCSVGLIMLFGASAMTQLYGMIIPGILSTGVKWYILKKSTGKGSKVLSSMVYNQLSIMIVMTVFGLASLMIINPVSLLMTETKNQWLLPAVCGILLIVVLSVTLLLLNGRTGGKITNALKLLLGPLPANVRQQGHTLIDHIAVFQTVGAWFHVTMAFITIIANLIGGVFMYVLSARAANVTAPLAVFVCLCAIVYVLGRVPITVANLGVREVTLVGFLTIYGVGKPAALLMSMILFSASVVMAVIGALYQISWTVSSKKTALQQSNSTP